MINIDPKLWIKIAEILTVFSIIGWPSTHILMLITDPIENSWVFHVLLAISWLAILYTAVGIIVAADIRNEQVENE